MSSTNLGPFSVKFGPDHIGRPVGLESTSCGPISTLVWSIAVRVLAGFLASRLFPKHAQSRESMGNPALIFAEVFGPEGVRHVRPRYFQRCRADFDRHRPNVEMSGPCLPNIVSFCQARAQLAQIGARCCPTRTNLVKHRQAGPDIFSSQEMLRSVRPTYFERFSAISFLLVLCLHVRSEFHGSGGHVAVSSSHQLWRHWLVGRLALQRDSPEFGHPPSVAKFANISPD